MPRNDKNDKDNADPFFQCLATLRNKVVAPPLMQQPAPATTTTTTLLQADLSSLGQQRKSLDQALHDALVDRQVTNDALETQLATHRQMQHQQAKLRQDLESMTTQHEAMLQRELDAQVQAAMATAAAKTALSQLEARTVGLELHAAELKQAVAHKTQGVQQARQQGRQDQVARQATMETLQADLTEVRRLHTKFLLLLLLLLLLRLAYAQQTVIPKMGNLTFAFFVSGQNATTRIKGNDHESETITYNHKTGKTKRRW